MNGDPYRDVPLGSRWYETGHHWEVVGHETRDGEPAARIKCLTGKSRRRVEHVLTVRTLLRRGTRMDEGREAA